MELASPAFEDGEPIPERHGYAEEDVNPPLEVSDVPDEAETLAIVVDDPDARDPAGKVWDHWVVWNVDPDRTVIPEGWDADERGSSSPDSRARQDAEGAVEGQNDFGEVGWGGPNPPDREHAYRFLVYALDDELDLQRGAKKDDLYDAAEGHLVEKAELEGTYAP
ncbi:YbhB/YbcL family Raf kinase inhibitor-like protein [Halomicrobium urmianum]|uniref:YbhB/YbcL family Raf kinase inhibitor-like protein n=1 Tax=Halomicrobium urmianum TaxID=1586233 RepID=UPI001CD94A13|nr:YbhB/YbcL family Raf kinase inhibitor-like protein [Halomicrobium urmianum]